MASAATAVAQGRYGIRVSPPQLGDDFDSLAQAFNQMAAQLQAVDASRRQLFGDLAHEIRTPVSVLDAYIEAVEDGIRSMTPDTTALLRDQTQRLVRFAEDVSGLAQAEEAAASLAFADIEMAELIVKTTAAGTERYRTKQVSLSTHFSPRLPPLWGDEQRLTQVLANLLDNALRHTPPHGQVDVYADTDGARLLLRVVDTGEGIAAEHLPHVFERLYRCGAHPRPRRRRSGPGHRQSARRGTRRRDQRQQSGSGNRDYLHHRVAVADDVSGVAESLTQPQSRNGASTVACASLSRSAGLIGAVSRSTRAAAMSVRRQK